MNQAAQQLDLAFYQWSVTEGLKIGRKDHSYYQTKRPTEALRMALAILKSADRIKLKAGLFVFKDLDKYLEDPTVLRLFKDLINEIRQTKDTAVIVAPAYKLPKDIEPYVAHIIGGYPTVEEIGYIINSTIEEIQKTNPKMQVILNKNQMAKVAKMLNGLSTQQIRNVISECALDDNSFDAADIARIELYKKRIFDREGILEFCFSESRANIAGFNNLKRWLSERRISFHPDASSNLPQPKGVLLMGVQGCGKSLAIKVIARELGLPLYRLDLSKLYSKYIGETEQNLRKALKTVEKLSPLCLWIDEIEKGFASSDGDIDGGVSQRILGTFLTWMQERKPGCFLAATANNIYMLQPEFLRKGRFDEIFFVDLPDKELRKEIFKIHLNKRAINIENFDLDTLADNSDSFSGAEIEQIIISALYTAASRQQTLATSHILEHLRSTKPLAVIKSEDITLLRNWASERTISA